jgi:hypothetical protein
VSPGKPVRSYLQHFSTSTTAQAGSIAHDGKSRDFGVFDTELELPQARDEAAFEFWGACALLNIYSTAGRHSPMPAKRLVTNLAGDE